MPETSRIKGLDKLEQHIPALRTGWGTFRMLLPSFLLAFLIYNFFAIEDSTFMLWLLSGEAIIGSLGFLILSLFFRLKQDMLARFGREAFSLAFTRIVLPALTIIFSVVARIGYIPGPLIPRFLWYPILPALGWIMVALGAALWIRAVATFGVDYVTMLYVYYPKEGRVVDHAIYGVIRHPVYAAALWISFGLALVNGSWFGPVLAVIVALGMWGWLRLVEEKELIERFGPSYAEYRQRVPAFWPRPRQLPAFFRFLWTGR